MCLSLSVGKFDMVFPRLKFFVVLTLCGLALYYPSLHFAPFFDDNNFFQRGMLNEIFLRGFTTELRWLPYFTMAWVDVIFDDHIYAQRLSSVLLHVLTAYALYVLVLQLVDHVAPHPHNKKAAMGAALLFLLHPLAVYAVGYLIQRSIVFATLFGLLSISAYLNGLITRKNTYFLFSALFYLLAVFSKEHAIMIPAVALAITPLVGEVDSKCLRRLVLPVLLYAGVAMLVVYKSLPVIGQVYEPHVAHHLATMQIKTGVEAVAPVWLLSAMTQSTLFFKYLGLMLVPNPLWMSIDMRVPVAQQAWEFKYLAGVLLFGIYAIVAFALLLKKGRRGLFGFALLAPLLLFLVEFSSVRIQEPFVLYRTYLWIWPIFILWVLLAQSLAGKSYWLVLLGMLLVLVSVSSERLQTFSTGFALWDDAVKKLPEMTVGGVARVYGNRGTWNAKNGNHQAAILDFSSALKADPGYKGGYSGRAYAYAKLGNYAAALQDAEVMVGLYPEDPLGLTLKGLILRDQGKINAAIESLQRACDMKSTRACVAISLIRQKSKDANLISN